MKKVIAHLMLYTSLLITLKCHATSGQAVAPQSLFEASVKTLSTAGIYKLAQDITGPVTLAANNISLDLNDYTISATSNNGIVVNTNLSRISVRNGSVTASSGNGIDIATGCSDITIHNIRAHLCDIGIKVVGTNSLFVEKCILKSNVNEGIKLTTCSKSVITKSKFFPNDIGIEIDQTSDSLIHKCIAMANSTKGFSLTSSTDITVLSCKSLLSGSGSANSAYGFISNNGSNNTFKKCVAEGTTTTGTSAAISANGFFFQGTETNSIITHCTASNSNTPAANSSTAFGIRLEETIGTITEVTSGNRTIQTNSISWNTYNNYLALAGKLATTELELYSLNQSDTLIGENSLSHGAEIKSAQWSPNSAYFAVVGLAGSGGYDTRVLRYDITSPGFVFIDGATHGAEVNSVSWLHTNNFLATGGLEFASQHIRLYEFSTYSETLTLKDSVNPGAEVFSIAWTPNNIFLAAGGNLSGADIYLYELKTDAKTLSLVDSVIHGAAVYSVAWTSDGKFLAIVGDTGTSSKDTRVYELDAGAKTLTLRDSQVHGDRVYSVAWAPDNSHLITGGKTVNSQNIRVYTFDNGTKTLTLQTSFYHGNDIRSVAWSPDGGHFGACGFEISSKTHRLYSGFGFPSNCFINNNYVYGTTGNVHKSSTGISLPSTLNLVANNTAYGNDINYRFVTGVQHQESPETLPNLSR